MPVVMREGRARMIASETPLTWRQVVLLAHQYTEEQSGWQVSHWLTWGPVVEVGEALWEYWVESVKPQDHEAEDEDDLPPSAGVAPTIRAQIGAADLPLWRGGKPRITARSVGQRPRR